MLAMAAAKMESCCWRSGQPERAQLCGNAAYLKKRRVMPASPQHDFTHREDAGLHVLAKVWLHAHRVLCKACRTWAPLASVPMQVDENMPHMQAGDGSDVQTATPDARAASISDDVISAVTMKAGLASHKHPLCSSSSAKCSDDWPFAFLGPSLCHASSNQLRSWSIRRQVQSSSMATH